MNDPPMSFPDVVVLLRDVPEEGLRRGYSGTVVFPDEPEDVESVIVEFIDETGDTFALSTLRCEDLIRITRPDRAEPQPGTVAA